MTTATTPGADEFERHRPRLFSLAYRMLGSADEAEDTVQDAYLRFTAADRTGIEHPAAWLAKVVTNLCLTRLTSARARRERYVGTWLPEPVVTADGTLGPLESAEQRDAVSTALLLLLERLTPTERAVYVLREAFAYGYREIAGALDLGEPTAVSCTGGRCGGWVSRGPGSSPRRSAGNGWSPRSSPRRARATWPVWRSCSPRT
ncbi:sigma-70 family RNA polymerase sigma factor [Streptomyces sp. BBFR51]|uniref:sigma-70 family RNA polymerase sigma factor n=1 Tax=Streptomyces sp. BBFR51 TaxID=3372856 RepID=UPI0037DBF9B3